MRATQRASAPKGASAQCDLAGRVRCDRSGEEILRAFWPDVKDGNLLPPELLGLTEAAQLGRPDTRRALIVEQGNERLRIEVTAVGRGRTQLHLWREVLKYPAAPLRMKKVVEGNGAQAAKPSPANGEGQVDGARAPPPKPPPPKVVIPPRPADAADDPTFNLTDREREVALLVANGLRSSEAGDLLGITAQTVKSHLKTIFDKLGVRNRVELARRLSPF